ncbi:MAG TPA: GGDEF domain-containing phosphodiesterase [Gemmatimonadaceae bacterium]|nr:GGDEF domain-containing phosphodiesterase [Gemmatimonadaceae bacterium]
MNKSVLLTDCDDPAVEAGVSQLDAWRAVVVPTRDLARAIGHEPHLRAVFVTAEGPPALREIVECAHAKGLPVVVGCRDEAARRRAVELRAEEWMRLPVEPEELAGRVRSALMRVQASESAPDLAARAEQAQMLYDFMTGLPTLPVMIERIRPQIKERGEVVVVYFNFVRYSKIEEIYGWEKLDAVLETTAAAVKEFLEGYDLQASRVMVGYTNDDDFIFFHVPSPGTQSVSEQQLSTIVERLQKHVAGRIEEVHGEDIATLFEIYVGLARVYYNPKLRLERLIYRGIREAANAAKSVEERERARRVDDLRTSLRDRAVYVDYHPIVVAQTRKIFGYEALARGVMRSLRSPEVMFDVAAQADMIWELSRLCRARALEGIETRLGPGELLFINVDPHDFTDPDFTEREVADPSRVVIEITERTAIKDYPKFRERLKAFRDIGYRFAVDDAGSGYAGLGSIANLEPDFIKLDISLISAIDTNFIKQNLVETMVKFAEEHDAMVIAEGVERAEELETVKQLGVPLVQGFFLHRPDLVPTFGLPAARAPR